MKLNRERYSDVFVPQLSESESQELWQNIEARAGATPIGSRKRRWAIAFGGAALVASAASALVWQRSSQPALAGQVMEAPARSAQELELPDGSKVELEAAARLRIERSSPEDARVVLTRGGAWFDVRHRASRSFVVQAGAVEVAVIGTRFRVSLMGDRTDAKQRVDVEVARGIVEVRRGVGSAPVRLEAGERWTSASGAAFSSAAIEPPTDKEISGPSTAMPLPPASAPAKAAPTPSSDLPGSSAELQTASDVFESANKARVAGNSRAAAALFDQLRRKYRHDPRAALSALQLGRIRLDELGDIPGAIEALNDALRLGGGGSLRDDARARLVEAYERSGSVTACRRAKLAYLSSEPRGAHRTAVERRCP